MMHGRSRTGIGLAVAFAAVASGCHHAIVESGRPTDGQVIEDKWADSFVHGLVPPDAVNTAQQCPNGIARVETRRSFMNGLVTALTWGIYSPMHIMVHCAAAGGEDMSEDRTVRVNTSAGERGLEAAIGQAARLSTLVDGPVFVLVAE
jgi:hypothetical protein